MSDADKTPDISKIISVLMENPDIIEKISSLAKTDNRESPSREESAEKEKSAPAVSVMSEEEDGAMRRERRSRLLCAIKPYLEPRRQEAIDSMIAIAEVLDTIKRR